jgi:hypothetical protein
VQKDADVKALESEGANSKPTGYVQITYLILFLLNITEFLKFWRMKASPLLLQDATLILPLLRYLLRMLFPLLPLRMLFPLLHLRMLFPLLPLRMLFPLLPLRMLFPPLHLLPYPLPMLFKFILKDPPVLLVGFCVVMQLLATIVQLTRRTPRSTLLGLLQN